MSTFTPIALQWRRRLFNILHKPNPHDPWARRIGIALAGLIILNAIAVAVETLPSLAPMWHGPLAWFEAASTIIYLVEYLLRIWVCVEQGHLAQPIKGRLRYMCQPLVLMDMIVVATYYLPIDMRFLRVLRLVRLLRVLGLEQLDTALNDIGRSIRSRSHLLIASVVLMAVSVYFSAALLYQIEHRAQPDVFTSIPATLWWAVVSLTTVGYGDMAPITTLGKLCAGITLVFGIGIFALPTATLTAAIIEAGSAPK